MVKRVKLLSSAIFGLYFEKFPGGGSPAPPDSSLDRNRLEIRPRIYPDDVTVNQSLQLGQGRRQGRRLKLTVERVILTFSHCQAA